MKVLYYSLVSVAVLAVMTIGFWFAIPNPHDRFDAIKAIQTVSQVNKWYVSDDDDFMSGKIDVAITLKDGTKFFLLGVDFDSHRDLHYAKIGRFGDFYVELVGNPDELFSDGKVHSGIEDVLSTALDDGLSAIKEFREIVVDKRVVDLLTKTDEVKRVLDKIPLMKISPDDFTVTPGADREYFRSIPQSFTIRLQGVEFRALKYAIPSGGSYGDF